VFLFLAAFRFNLTFFQAIYQQFYDSIDVTRSMNNFVGTPESLESDDFLRIWVEPHDLGGTSAMRLRGFSGKDKGDV
jgi:hypothetical protein